MLTTALAHVPRSPWRNSLPRSPDVHDQLLPCEGYAALACATSLAQSALGSMTIAPGGILSSSEMRQVARPRSCRVEGGPLEVVAPDCSAEDTIVP